MTDPAATWTNKIRKATKKQRWNFIRPEDLRALMGSVEDVPPPVLEARAQKAALLWLRNQLVGNLSVNQEFHDKTGVGWMDKLLTQARLKELAGVKIAKAGKSSGLRYDIAGLQATWYGRRILESLGFNKRRSSVDKDEFGRIVEACARINLTLPETVSPTTTERFFEGGEA